MGCCRHELRPLRRAISQAAVSSQPAALLGSLRLTVTRDIKSFLLLLRLLQQGRSAAAPRGRPIASTAQERAPMLQSRSEHDSLCVRAFMLRIRGSERRQATVDD
jgi:hypothetical protein